MIEAHAARALHDRFQDNGCDFMMVLVCEFHQGSNILGIPDAVKGRRGCGREQLFGKNFGEYLMHAGHWITDRHCGERVAVISATHGQQAVFAR